MLKKNKTKSPALVKDVKHFTNSVVSMDLFFIIIMISINVNDVIASEIVNELFIINRNIKLQAEDDYYVI